MKLCLFHLKLASLMFFVFSQRIFFCQEMIFFFIISKSNSLNSKFILKTCRTKFYFEFESAKRCQVFCCRQAPLIHSSQLNPLLQMLNSFNLSFFINCQAADSSGIQVLTATLHLCDSVDHVFTFESKSQVMIITYFIYESYPRKQRDHRCVLNWRAISYQVAYVGLTFHTNPTPLLLFFIL